MIKSFACKATEAIFQDSRTPDLPSPIQTTARRKLVQINLAQQLSDLRVPPGNHLEALRSNRKGQHSIRINDQWRVCFIWTPSGAENVKIEDYH
jgi:proteic killer suppression protein